LTGTCRNTARFAKNEKRWFFIGEIKSKAQEKIPNIDLRALPPFERHAKIIKAWKELEKGQTMRLTNDHEPKPLYYQFQAEENGKFEWNYEKQGPKEWVFTIKKLSGIAGKDRKQEVKELIKQLHSGASAEEVKSKGKDLLKTISPLELGLIEQEIIKEGISREEMRRLCDVHLEIMKESLGKTELKLKPGHPIHTMMEEHKKILEFLEMIDNAVKSLKTAKGFSEAREEIETIRHAVHHLVEADKHHQREEEALFPALESKGISEPPEIMREEHEDLKQRKKALEELAIEPEKTSFEEFVKKAAEYSEFLQKELASHIYKEDNILYPMALKAIPKKEWKAIKEKCDAIGYCCFTPAH